MRRRGLRALWPIGWLALGSGCDRTVVVGSDWAETAAAGPCSEDTKPCMVNGEIACVSKTDPNYGCGNASCLACSFENVKEPGCDGDGNCTIVDCMPGWADCNRAEGAGIDDGCESPIDISWDHCGPTCERCDGKFPHAFTTCESGECRKGICKPGYYDCDADSAAAGGAKNGCESTEPCR